MGSGEDWQVVLVVVMVVVMVVVVSELAGMQGE